MDISLNLNNKDEKEKYIILLEDRKIDVYLMIIEYEIFNKEKCLVAICKKKELENIEELSIKDCINNSEIFKINLTNRKRDIKEIKSNNTILTFIPIFCDDTAYDNFKNSEKFKEYISHINKYKKIMENNFIKKRCILMHIIIAIPIVAFIIGFGFLLKYLLAEKEDIPILKEEEDDDSYINNNIIYVKDLCYNFRNVEDILIFYNNSNLKYRGSLKNYEAEGEGIYYSKDYNQTIIYEGYFKKGLPNGNGTKYYYEGNKKIGYYNGSWINSKRSGRGEMHNYKEGIIYNGLWKNDKRHGKGKINYTNGDYYEGDFMNGLKEGKGIYYYLDCYYNGGWKEDKRHGEGKIYCKDGIYYNGYFYDDKFKGKGYGKLYYGFGQYYEGDFMDGKWEGKGKFRYPNGYYYEGEFKDGKRHGEGKVFSSSENKIICEGTFKDDEYQKSFLEGLKSIFTSEPHCY